MKEKIEVGDQVKEYVLCIPFDKECLYKKERSITPYNVLGVNGDRFVIDDEFFTRLEIRKSIINDALDKPKISIRTKERFFNSLRYTLFTQKNKKWSTIRREIEAKIEQEFGALMQIDLDFVTKEN